MDTTVDIIRDVRIRQSKRGYRFSVDALMLYSFVNMTYARRVADLGAGSGIIGILLARRYPRSRVTLFEFQDRLARFAQENAEFNGLSDRVSVEACDVRTIPGRGALGGPFAADSYDLVVSNPPFRRPKTGRMSPHDEKAVARHELFLGLDDIAAASHRLLRGRGRLCVIHLPERLPELIAAFAGRRLTVKRLRFVHSFSDSPAKMVLVEAVKEGRPGLTVERPFVVYEAPEVYTAEARALGRPPDAGEDSALAR